MTNHNGTAPRIAAHDVTRAFVTKNTTVDALGPFNVAIADREFVSIVGPSGCGKSTFLRIVGGLLRPSSGRTVIADDESGRPLSSFVFQDYSVYPWKTVTQNVAWTLRVGGMPSREAQTVALEWIRRVGLGGFADAYPATLSGGMRQRVAIARAFASNPQVLLMDEPFAALDAQLRTVMQEELAGLCDAAPRTVVFVTHSIDEAIILSDTILVMSASPGMLLARYDVNLDRPRDPSVVNTDEARRLRAEIWGHLESEVTKTLAGQAVSA